MRRGLYQCRSKTYNKLNAHAHDLGQNFDNRVYNLRHHRRHCVHDLTDDPGQIRKQGRETRADLRRGVFFPGNHGSETRHDLIHAGKKVGNHSAPDTRDGCLKVLQIVLKRRRIFDGLIGHHAAQFVNPVLHRLCIFGGSVQECAKFGCASAQKLTRKICSFGFVVNVLKPGDGRGK